MPVVDVLAALKAMADPQCRRRLAEGHLDDLEGVEELDEHERQLVRAAAAEYPMGSTGSFSALARAEGRATGLFSTDRFGAYGEAVRYTDGAYRDRWDGADDVAAVPVVRATDPDQVAGAPSFAAWAAHWLYDPVEGYYGSGQVRFGPDGDFWTYPERLSPLFGAMVAESVRTVVDEWTWAGLLADDDPLTILELGAGQGVLAADVIDHVTDPATVTWAPYRMGLRYVVGDRSPAMRARQRATLAPWLEHDHEGGDGDGSTIVEVRDLDAVELSWSGPLRGAVVANELLDALVHECLRVDPDGEVVRVHVRAGPEGPVELEVPLRWGWFGPDGVPGPWPEALPGYLARVLPVVEQVRARGDEPAELWWAPELPELVARLADIVGRPGSLAVVVLVDYGDGTVEGIDTDEGRLRVYGEDQIHGVDPYRHPGASDLTWDVDFGELARLAREQGLAVRFAGPQAALEVPPVDLASPEALDRLVPGREDEGATPGVHALASALVLVEGFRSATNGYRVMMLTAPDVPFPTNAFGPRQRLG